MEKQKKILSLAEEKVFKMRLDLYWQSTAIYAVILIIYSFLVGSFEKNKMTFAIDDPLAILLFIFILLSSLALLINFYKKLSIVIKNNTIIFRTRFGERIVSDDMIERISLGKEKRFKVQRTYRIVKIKLKNRRRIIRIRPSNYSENTELLNYISLFKKKFNK